ncbi:C40 family peptidase [Arthrobacter glacialis]|uniref:C40 family peptidase n=1 Tax=Arthrobacter glacialis TaxID=1664 RepID=UPI001FAF45BC|nr:C40 family peptidase [Arthrobacter glacialis]
MKFSPGKSRPYQLSMAVACTLLASGGFVGAGYVGTSTADTAAALSAQNLIRTAETFQEATPLGFDSFAAQGLGVKISFADTLILAKKPAAKQIFDLTDPNGNTPQLGRSVSAMRGDIPEVSAELISKVRKDILAAAYQGLGHSYVWGGTSFENGWDCSGFVQWAYRQAGVGLPRTEQWLPMVETNNPQPGDIVVQNPDGPNHWSHIGIYIGGGKMISALNPSVGTILHTPASTSSSSTYFTMPAFAAADEKARAEAAKDKSTSAPGASTSPSAKPAPDTTPPATTDPGTTAPTTPPVTTDPGTTPPVTTPPATTDPATTPPATTDPATTPPATTDPATTPPATVDPTPEVTSPQTATAPVANPPASTAPTTSEPVTEGPSPTATERMSALATEPQSIESAFPAP